MTSCSEYPWVLRPWGVGCYTVDSANGMEVAVTGPNSANGEIIRAAPELRDALDKFVQHVHSIDCASSGGCLEICTEARKLLSSLYSYE